MDNFLRIGNTIVNLAQIQSVHTFYCTDEISSTEMRVCQIMLIGIEKPLIRVGGEEADRLWDWWTTRTQDLLAAEPDSQTPLASCAIGYDSVSASQMAD